MTEVGIKGGADDGRGDEASMIEDEVPTRRSARASMIPDEIEDEYEIEQDQMDDNN